MEGVDERFFDEEFRAGQFLATAVFSTSPGSDPEVISADGEKDDATMRVIVNMRNFDGQMSVVRKELTKRVRKRTGELAEAMRGVGDVEFELSQTLRQCNEARRTLADLKQKAATQQLALLSTTAQRRHLTDIVQLSSRLQSLRQYERRFHEAVARDDFMAALARRQQALDLLKAEPRLEQLTCAETIINRVRLMHDSLRQVLDARLDVLLKGDKEDSADHKDVFRSDLFRSILGAYVELGMVAAVADRVENSLLSRLCHDFNRIVGYTVPEQMDGVHDVLPALREHIRKSTREKRRNTLALFAQVCLVSARAAYRFHSALNAALGEEEVLHLSRHMNPMPVVTAVCSRLRCFLEEVHLCSTDVATVHAMTEMSGSTACYILHCLTDRQRGQRHEEHQQEEQELEEQELDETRQHVRDACLRIDAALDSAALHVAKALEVDALTNLRNAMTEPTAWSRLSVKGTATQRTEPIALVQQAISNFEAVQNAAADSFEEALSAESVVSLQELQRRLRVMAQREMTPQQGSIADTASDSVLPLQRVLLTGPALSAMNAMAKAAQLSLLLPRATAAAAVVARSVADAIVFVVTAHFAPDHSTDTLEHGFPSLYRTFVGVQSRLTAPGAFANGVFDEVLRQHAATPASAHEALAPLAPALRQRLANREHLFALADRLIATESLKGVLLVLRSIVWQLTRCTERLASSLGSSSDPLLDAGQHRGHDDFKVTHLQQQASMFNRVLLQGESLFEELRLFMVQQCAALPFRESVVAAVAAQADVYARSDMSDSHSPVVDSIVGAFARFANTLTQCGLRTHGQHDDSSSTGNHSKSDTESTSRSSRDEERSGDEGDLFSDAVCAALEYLIQQLVEAFSRVIKCTTEGRMQMLQDRRILQQMLQGLAPLTPGREQPSWRPLDEFINAYFLPQQEYLDFAMRNHYYTKAQLLSLARALPFVEGLKKKARVAFLDEVARVCDSR
ncbi:MAG: hypothetical protein MHM6MM_001829 [Cercozoa sp. M6MM]